MSFDHKQSLSNLSNFRHGLNQTAGVRVFWLFVDASHVRLFNNPARIHHRDPGTHACNDSKIVCD